MSKEIYAYVLYMYSNWYISPDFHSNFSFFFSLFILESPVSVKMRIRHYFSHLALNTSASYDVRQGFDKQFDLIEDYDRRCQTLQHPPRKPTRTSVQSRNTNTTPRSSSVPALGPPNGFSDKTKVRKLPAVKDG